MSVSVEYIREVLNYDKANGVFTWAKPVSRRIKVGSIAGSIGGSGYRYISIKSRLISAHRLAWFYVHGVWPKCLDHINGKTDDNRLVNLRDGTVSQNQANAKKRKDSTSGFKGVYRVNSKWASSIQCQKKAHFLGCFETPEAAHAAYVAASKRLFGEFGRAA